MIDFRYHLVSLMAVLIALTLGVILGAGPLQGKISESISGEVQRLSKQQAALQQEKENLAVSIATDKKYLTAFTDRAIKGQLKNKKVALIKLGDVAEDIVKRQVKAVETAGAKVISQATVANGWGVAAAQNYRHSLLAPLKEKLGDTVIINSDSEETIMFMGLVDAVADTTEKAVAIRDMLLKPYRTENKEYNFLHVDQAPQDKADAIIVLSAPQPEYKKTKDKKDENLNFSDAGIKSLAVALTTKTERGVVFVGSAASDSDLITRIRKADLQVNTVDNINIPVSAAVTVLALKGSIDGKIGAYGTQNEASTLVPPSATSE